jgi:glutamine amidotransferase
MDAVVTFSRYEIASADAVMLPGVGAFSSAMAELRRRDLVGALREVAAATAKPLVGICLGMQLLMTESSEFGKHPGLGILEGPVVPLVPSAVAPGAPSHRLKVPHVGWTRVYASGQVAPTSPEQNSATAVCSDPLMNDLVDGAHMYFVHSYYVVPEDPSVVTMVSRFGDLEFCAGLSHKNVTAFQFHPERSGPDGLQIYRNLATILNEGP